MTRLRAVVVVIAVLVMTMSLSGTPAVAAGAGPVTFAGIASFPDFPGNGGGVFNGTASGSLQGTGRTGPYSVNYFQQRMAVTFTHNTPASTCPLTGSATTPGTQGFVIEGASTGTHWQFRIHGDLSWVRGGSSMAIQFSNVTLSLNGVVVEDGGSGAAKAFFESPNAVTNCLAGGGPMTATIAGSGGFVFPGDNTGGA